MCVCVCVCVYFLAAQRFQSHFPSNSDGRLSKNASVLFYHTHTHTHIHTCTHTQKNTEITFVLYAMCTWSVLQQHWVLHMWAYYGMPHCVSRAALHTHTHTYTHTHIHTRLSGWFYGSLSESRVQIAQRWAARASVGSSGVKSHIEVFIFRRVRGERLSQGRVRHLHIYIYIYIYIYTYTFIY